MDYDEFLRGIFNVVPTGVTTPSFLVLGADYGDAFVANKMDPHLLALRHLTNEIIQENYSEIVHHMYLTLRVDGLNASWHIKEVTRVILLLKLKYIRGDVHFLNQEVMGSTPNSLRNLLSKRIVEAASACVNRLEKGQVEFERSRFQDDLNESIERLLVPF